MMGIDIKPKKAKKVVEVEDDENVEQASQPEAPRVADDDAQVNEQDDDNDIEESDDDDFDIADLIDPDFDGIYVKIDGPVDATLQTPTGQSPLAVDVGDILKILSMSNDGKWLLSFKFEALGWVYAGEGSNISIIRLLKAVATYSNPYGPEEEATFNLDGPILSMRGGDLLTCIDEGTNGWYHVDYEGEIGMYLYGYRLFDDIGYVPGSYISNCNDVLM